MPYYQERFDSESVVCLKLSTSLSIVLFLDDFSKPFKLPRRTLNVIDSSIIYTDCLCCVNMFY
uniref:Uncharacterized protein n=1 Tax=Vibrio owensii TaxID=696485 RepID=A0A1S6KSG6_9VIBR|nr:hypothetical protein [Vibrio owensii]